MARDSWTATGLLKNVRPAYPCAFRAVSALMMVATVLTPLVSGSSARSIGSDAALAFDIPSLPLESALASFDEKSGFQVLYETTLTTGRRSHELKGTYTPDTALRRLLSGTGLSFDYIEDHAFTLVEAPPRSTRSVMDFHDYLGVVQDSLMAALCARAETQPGVYNIAMQFSIGRAGKLENVHLLNSTGALR
jgi:Secretin and TonB N terminus short domain